MNSISLPVGSLVCDSLPFSMGGTAGNASALKAAGYVALAGYLGAMNKARLGALHGAGLGYIPVTFGGEYEDGPLDELAQLKALGVCAGTTVFLDMEGLKAFKADVPNLLVQLRAWATAIVGAGYVAGLYMGVPQPLTSAEAMALPFTRYWKGQGSLRDRSNALVEPACGFCMTQMYPSITRGGVLIDANIVGQDFRGRVPTACFP